MGSLLIMAGLFVYQLKTNREIQKDHKEAYGALGSQIAKNTEVQQEMVHAIREFRETDRKVIQSIEYCKNKNGDRSGVRP